MGKLKSLDSSYKKELADKTDSKIISVVKQCKLLNYNRSNLFYVPMVNPIKQDIKNEIVKIFVDILQISLNKDTVSQTLGHLQI